MLASMDNPLTSRNRQAMMVAGVVVAILAAAIALPSTLAPGTNNTQSNGSQSGAKAIPDIKGSVSIQTLQTP